METPRNCLTRLIAGPGAALTGRLLGCGCFAAPRDAGPRTATRTRTFRRTAANRPAEIGYKELYCKLISAEVRTGVAGRQAQSAADNKVSTLAKLISTPGTGKIKKSLEAGIPSDACNGVSHARPQKIGPLWRSPVLKFKVARASS
jgi:hypothetical protein